MNVGESDVVVAVIAAMAAIVAAAINMKKGSRLERDIRQYGVLRSERQGFQEDELKDLRASIVLRVSPNNRKVRRQATGATALFFFIVFVIFDRLYAILFPDKGYCSQMGMVFFLPFLFVAVGISAVSSFSDIRDNLQLRFLNSDKSEKLESPFGGSSEKNKGSLCADRWSNLFHKSFGSL